MDSVVVNIEEEKLSIQEFKLPQSLSKLRSRLGLMLQLLISKQTPGAPFIYFSSSFEFFLLPLQLSCPMLLLASTFSDLPEWSSLKDYFLDL